MLKLLLLAGSILASNTTLITASMSPTGGVFVMTHFSLRTGSLLDPFVTAIMKSFSEYIRAINYIKKIVNKQIYS